MNFMEMVGPPGLEPGDVGYATPARVTEPSRPLVLRQWPAGAYRGVTEEGSLTVKGFALSR